VGRGDVIEPLPALGSLGREIELPRGNSTHRRSPPNEAAPPGSRRPDRERHMRAKSLTEHLDRARLCHGDSVEQASRAKSGHASCRCDALRHSAVASGGWRRRSGPALAGVIRWKATEHRPSRRSWFVYAVAHRSASDIGAGTGISLSAAIMRPRRALPFPYCSSG
jgi:hypothetical protein